METDAIEVKPPRPREPVQFLNGAKQFARSVGIEIDTAIEAQVLALLYNVFTATQTPTMSGLLPILPGDARPVVHDYDCRNREFQTR